MSAAAEAGGLEYQRALADYLSGAGENALEGALLGDLLHGEEHSGSIHAVCERGSRDGSAKTIGEVSGSVGEKALAGE